MKKSYDVVVIGGGIIGMATAYYLAQKNFDIAIIEKTYIGSGSTTRCIGGIRQQFSTPSAIRLMKENVRLFSKMEQEFGFSVDFYQGGYMFLAHSPELVEVFKTNTAVQQKEGVNVKLLSPQEAKEVVPQLNTDGLLAATYCPDDAQAFPFAILKGYREGIEKNGGDFLVGTPVKKIEKKENLFIEMADGTKLESAKVILAAGPWSGELGKTIGLDLPLFPERHEAIITERVDKFFDPMIVDYRSDGCYFNQMVTGQIIGCYTPVPNVPGIKEDASFEFLPRVAHRMRRLIPELEKISILRHWAGCYTMTPDGNPLVDESEIPGLYVASGMCGHGFMFGPAIGKHLAHFVKEGQWLTDFSEFALNRKFESKENMK